MDCRMEVGKLLNDRLYGVCCYICLCIKMKLRNDTYTVRSSRLLSVYLELLPITGICVCCVFQRLGTLYNVTEICAK
jgi:hypothetical protein